jgi:hypothetical protein
MAASELLQAAVANQKKPVSNQEVRKELWDRHKKEASSRSGDNSNEKVDLKSMTNEQLVLFMHNRNKKNMVVHERWYQTLQLTELFRLAAIKQEVDEILKIDKQELEAMERVQGTDEEMAKMIKLKAENDEIRQRNWLGKSQSDAKYISDDALIPKLDALRTAYVKWAEMYHTEFLATVIDKNKITSEAEHAKILAHKAAKYEKEFAELCDKYLWASQHLHDYYLNLAKKQLDNDLVGAGQKDGDWPKDSNGIPVPPIDERGRKLLFSEIPGDPDSALARQKHWLPQSNGVKPMLDFRPKHNKTSLSIDDMMKITNEHFGIASNPTLLPGTSFLPTALPPNQESLYKVGMAAADATGVSAAAGAARAHQCTSLRYL